MKAVYISGKVSGLPIDEVVKKFAKAQDLLEEAGHKVVNPVERIIRYNSELRGIGRAPLTEEADRAQILRIDISLLMGCDAIFLIPDWRGSTGAALEAHIAQALGMEVITL